MVERSTPALRTVQQPPEQVLALFGPERLAERLQQIQSVTDAALAHLELDALLSELLQRLRTILQVDAVRVLLCTKEGRALTVRASLGLEQIGTDPVVIPVGQGLAGRVASRREAVIVDDVSAIEIVDPAIRILASAMVAPLLAEGRLIGVLKVGTLAPRTFNEADLSLLQLVGDRVALAVHLAQQHEKLRAETETRLRALNALHESEERFRLLVEQVEDYAIFLLDPEGRIASWNRGAERLKGYTEAEVLGRHFSIFYPPEAVESGFPDHELRVAARAGRYEDEGWRVRQDGSLFWANVVITALRKEDRLVGYAKVTRDLTKRRQAEEALRESEARFRVFAETASDAIFTMDEASIILYANPAVERIFGYRPDELLGQSMQLLIPEPFRSRHREGVKHYVATGERRIPWSGVELPGLHKRGREVALEISFGEYTRDGKIYFTGIVRDVTERVAQQHHLEATAAELEATIEELQIRTQEAEAANQAKTEFLAVMSHELRTPLNAIIGYAELMHSGIPEPLPNASLVQVERIGQAARHQLTLVEEILSFARIVSGQETVDWGAVDLGKLARLTADYVRPAAEQRGLPLIVSTPEVPLMLQSDEAKLRQILVNMLSNAVKFTSEGEVSVVVKSDGGHARVYVSDTGVGIAPGNLKKIFDPFWQVDQGTTRESAGTGLGLTISHRLAQLLGGGISVRSTPGAGTVFLLELPLGAAERSDSSESLNSPGP